MRKALRYGQGSVVVDLPAGDCRGIVEPGLPPAIGEIEAVVARSVERPVSGRPLSEVVRGKRRVVVVVPDATRRAGLQGYLPALLRCIERAGAGPHDVVVLTATGAHRKHADSEREALVGSEVASRWTVEDHDADEGNVEIEPLDSETPLAVDRRVVEADCIILAGPISYHYCAGFGGGRKLLAPGVCGRATVEALHRRTLANIDGAGDWRSRTGVLRDNPFNEALRKAAERIGPDFALNVSVDWRGAVIGLTAGEPFRSHLVACLEYDRIFRVPLEGRAGAVVASCGGRPWDVNLYQAHKALDNAFRAVRDGGTIVLLAECVEGWGPPAFVEWLAIDSLEAHRQRLEERFEVVGHTTYALKWKATRCAIVVVSKELAGRVARGDAPAWLAKARPDGPFHLEVVAGLEDALGRAGIGAGSDYYLMPMAACTLPEVVSR